jgi:phage gp46-like protein
MSVDLKLTKDNEGTYDIGFQSNGDFELEEGFDTALLMSLFQNKRLDESEQPIPQFRDGWWGNLLNDNQNYEIGSKLWALDGRRTQNTLNQALDFIRDSLQWFLDEGYLKDVRVSGAFTSEEISELSFSESTITFADNGMVFLITLVRFNNKSEKQFFDLWENTDLA